MKIRVHELAKELGCTSKEVLRVCSELGEFVKSSSSLVDSQIADRVREKRGTADGRLRAEDYGNSLGGSRPAVVDDGGFGAAVAKAQRNTRRRTSQPSSAEIPKAIYKHVIDPQRSRQGKYTPEEVDRAERLAREWAQTWLPDVVEWIRVSAGDRPDVAAKLAEAGLTPADADLRLGFGRIDPTADTIFRRVAKGRLGMRDAIRQVRAFRQSEGATGS